MAHFNEGSIGICLELNFGWYVEENTKPRTHVTTKKNRAFAGTYITVATQHLDERGPTDHGVVGARHGGYVAKPLVYTPVLFSQV